MKKKVKRTTKKVKKSIKRMGLFIAIILLVAIVLGGRFYRYINGNNIDLSKVEQPCYVYILNETNFTQLKSVLTEMGVVKDIESFTWLAQKKRYDKNIKGGRYLLEDGMSNNKLINLLRSGKQEPLKITFNNLRTLNQLASVIGQKLMVDSAALLHLFHDQKYINNLGFTYETLPGLFIPNTYEMYWNTDAKGFVQRMKKEYDRFWTAERIQKAEDLGLSKEEVSIVASIVDEETVMSDEKPVVAGLYLNRLNRHMKLQADPTIKFAIGDFTIKRIIKSDLLIDSPYNTYKYAGLPPGPIRIPSIVGIDAVLNRKKHDYLYMCAKEDFSGYHNFAKTLTQHNVNARNYQNELRKRKIWR